MSKQHDNESKKSLELKRMDYPLYDNVLLKIRNQLMTNQTVSPGHYKDISTLVDEYIKNSGVELEEPRLLESGKKDPSWKPS